MRCAYCSRQCDVRPTWRITPIHMQAICWDCWYERYGKKQAVREWKEKRWWRRLVP